ncbi:MAG: NFACT family protein, partial [Clostridia bacterium]|nr:NFACT family protein [Clostridia bacterium]
MDGLTLAASVFEMQSLVGGKIEKIQQPEKNELLFSVHTTNGSRRLIISSSSDNCRIHITAEKRTSPLDAPNFLMVLRKHLLGSRIVSIEQPNLDRIVFIRFSALTELSDITELTLACEIMGRHSNIILIDKNGIIIDSIRHVPAGMSSVRLVLPRIEYAVPPVQEKLDPLGCSSDTFAKLILGSQRPDKALSSAVYGLSPAVASLLLQAVSAAAPDAHDDNEFYLNAENCATVGKRLCLFYKDLAACKTTPCIASLGDKSVLLPFVPYGLIHTDYSAVSEAADSYYRLRSEAESAHRRTASIGHILETNIQRLEKRAERFALSIGDEAEIEKLRLNGELITANLYALPERTDSAACMNYYLDPPATVVIPLDPKLTVSANAQLYYKKYRKAKAAREYALSKRDETLAEIDYLYSVSSDLEKCNTDSDYEEVKYELIAAVYIRQERK